MKGNAITQRIEQLQSFWMTFRRNDKARVCCWALEDDERPLVEEFFNMECSVYGKTPDFFIKFESPFRNGRDYEQILVAELNKKMTDYQAAFGNEAVQIDCGESVPV